MIGKGGCSGQRRRCLSWPRMKHPMGSTVGSFWGSGKGMMRGPASSTVWNLSSSAEAPSDSIDWRRKVTTYQLQNSTLAVPGGWTGKE